MTPDSCLNMIPKRDKLLHLHFPFVFILSPLCLPHYTTKLQRICKEFANSTIRIQTLDFLFVSLVVTPLQLRVVQIDSVELIAEAQPVGPAVVRPGKQLHLQQQYHLGQQQQHAVPWERPDKPFQLSCKFHLVFGWFLELRPK